MNDIHKIMVRFPNIDFILPNFKKCVFNSNGNKVPSEIQVQYPTIQYNACTEYNQMTVHNG